MTEYKRTSRDTFLGTEKVTACTDNIVNGMDDDITVYHEHGGVSIMLRREFMKKYNSVDNQSFGTALEYLKQGERLNRFGWLKPDAYIELGPAYPIYSEETQKTTNIRPFIQFVNAHYSPVPWVATNEDLLSIDWRVVSRKDIKVSDLVYIYNYDTGSREEFCPYVGKVGKVISIATNSDDYYTVRFGDIDWLFLRKELIRVGY